MRLLHHPPARRWIRRLMPIPQRPAIYICGIDEVPEVLASHREIRFLASIVQIGMEEDFAKFRAAGHPGLRLHHLQVDDVDQRSAGRGRLADADTVGALIAFFREWMDAAQGGGPPSLLVHCMQGKYRSGAAALIAHSMLTGDPLRSARALVECGWETGIDANWEIARHADDLLGFGGALHRAAINIERAVRVRDRQTGELPPGEVARNVDAALRADTCVVFREAGPRGLPIVGRAFTDLHLAAARGDVDGIAGALAAGIPIDSLDADGGTALHAAVRARRKDCVLALLDAGADTGVRDRYASTPGDHGRAWLEGELRERLDARGEGGRPPAPARPG